MSTPTPSTDLLRRLEDQRLIAIIRASDADTAAARVQHLVAIGVALVEISLSTPDALETLQSLSASGGASPSLLGVGTVLTAEDLHRAADAGARFAVTPTTDPEVLGAAVERDIPIIPGAATPSEIQRAVVLGATAVKLFPASLWSLEAFGDLRQVFPTVAFVPTGGIDAVQAPRWVGAGAIAVGLGSAVTSADADLADLLDRLQEVRG